MTTPLIKTNEDPIHADYVIVDRPNSSNTAWDFTESTLNTIVSTFKTIISGRIVCDKSHRELPRSIKDRISSRKHCSNTVLIEYTKILNQSLGKNTIQYHFTFPVRGLCEKMFPLSESALTFFPIVLTHYLGSNHIVLLIVDENREAIVFYDSNGKEYEELSSSYVIGNSITLKELFEKLKVENSRLNNLQLEEKPIKYQRDLHNCGFYVMKFIMDYLSGNNHSLTHEEAEESFRKELLTKGPDIFDPIINQYLKEKKQTKIKHFM